MTVFRVIAILVALGGVLDPALSLSRPVPTLVRLYVDRSDPDAADVEARLRAAMHDRLEFVAGGDADAHVVRGLIAIMQRLFSGQKTSEILGFDVEAFFRRIGLDSFITTQRRNGLAGMVKRIRQFAEEFSR